MAGVAGLDTRCAVGSCGQLDFLPLKCRECTRSFCKDHFQDKEHACISKSPASTLSSCPSCGQTIAIPDQPGGSGSVSHVCTHGKPHCGVEGCQHSMSVNIVHCSGCGKIFCTTHRHPEDHSCTKLQEPSVRKQPMAPHAASSSTKPATAKKPLPRAILISKLKMRAVGDKKIAPESRLYLQVVFPLEADVRPRAMFFNDSWTLGKVLDVACKEASVPNENNLATASTRLRLFSWKHSERPLDTGSLLKDVVASGTLANGDILCIARVEALDMATVSPIVESYDEILV